MATKKKTVTSEEIDLTALFAQLTTAAAEFVKAVDAISKSTYDAEGTDLMTDLCGKTVVIARRTRTEYKKRMKTFTGSSIKNTMADSIADKLVAIRKQAQSISVKASEVIQETAEAKTALAAQESLWMESNAPKAAMQLEKAKKRQIDEAKRIARLEAMVAGAGKRKTANG